jgi:hypothetical protein
MADPDGEGPAPKPPSSGSWKRDVARLVIGLAIVAGLWLVGYYGQTALKYLGPAQKCWEYKEVDGKLYKVNPCTGQFQLMGDVTPEAGK